MEQDHPHDSKGGKLRQRAEQAFRERNWEQAQDPRQLLDSALIEELRIHQIELEMQNEELRQAQLELDATRARYFDLYDLAPVGYVTLADNGIIREANLTAAGLLGVTRADVVGRPLSAFVFSEDQDLYYLNRKKLLSSGKGRSFELRLVRRTAGPFWARVEAALETDEPGPQMCRLVMSDISANRQAEARLRQAQKMELVGVLAGGVAHEFNNLLTVMNGHAMLLRDAMKEGDPKKKEIDVILHAGQRAAELTKSLLAFAGKQVLKPVVFDVNTLLARTRPILEQLVGERVKISLRLWAEPCPVYADANAIEQVVINLALNARDAMPGGGSLTIETAAVEFGAADIAAMPDAFEGLHVSVTVTDNGVGMDEKLRQRIFEPFFTTKPVGQGTGLGLSTARGTVAQSRGFIQVTSNPGDGTCFRIVLPRASEVPTTPPRQDDCFDRPRGEETILVVEDEPAVRDFLCRALSALGYRVIQAEDGAQAHLILEGQPEGIDLVLVDLVLPRFGGTELARTLKERWPRIGILPMTGGAPEAWHSAGGQLTDMQCLLKPFTIEVLATHVRLALERRNQPSRRRASGAGAGGR